MLNGKFCYWYVADCFGYIACNEVQNELRQALCHILKMSINEASTIGGHVSWVIWRATGCT
jgi:hypothetical protein